MESSKIHNLRDSWDLLEDVFPLFQHSEILPTIETAERGWYSEAPRGWELDRFKDCVTKLRVDLRLNALKRQHARIDQLRALHAITELLDETMTVLRMFEHLVADEVLSNGGVKLSETSEMPIPQVGSETIRRRFPKLFALRVILSENAPDSSLDTPLSGSRGLFDEDEGPHNTSSVASNIALNHTVGFIEFPTNPAALESIQRRIETFNKALTRVFAKADGQWKAEAQTQYFSEGDISTILNPKESPKDRDTDSSLADDFISLHTAGRETDMCHEAKWIAASFTSPLQVDEVAESPLVPCQVCLGTQKFVSELTALCVALKPASQWETPSSLITNQHATASTFGSLRISDLLRSTAAPQRSIKPPEQMHRKLLGVLLACALFEMCGSSWIHTLWRRDMIYVHQYPRDFKRLDQLRLRIPCTLSELSLGKWPNSESIAAFGVLLLELEANNEADWDLELDVDLEDDVLSNQVRLGRVLREWETSVRDDYRAISQACHDFDNLVKTVDHPQIRSERRHAAVVYKCILEPLLKLLLKDFSTARRLFDGVSGPWNSISAALRISPHKVTKRILFDDFDAPNTDKKAMYAEQFMEGLLAPLQAVGEMSGRRDRDKIRIAVLDSGVCADDPRISRALASGRIKGRKSWVGSSEDTYGHGTIITRLLLKMAPAAEMYIGKICIGKEINEEFIPGIAKAIRWAVEECKVHIISLSLGFEGRYESVESAIDFAVERGTLVVAAASNNGALSDRSRPARRSDVLCIHASDGLGNAGDMNPSPKTAMYNFSTLGVAVPSRWKNTDVWKSVEFDWGVSHRHILYKKRGMEAIFQAMSERRNGYDFVNLARLWRHKTQQDVARAIEKILESL